MRAKLKVTAVGEVTGSEENPCQSLHFSAVGKSSQYPDDGSDEDNTFARFTPVAEANFTITNPALIDKYKVGQVYYVDFTAVEAEPVAEVQTDAEDKPDSDSEENTAE